MKIYFILFCKCYQFYYEYLLILNYLISKKLKNNDFLLNAIFFENAIKKN